MVIAFDTEPRRIVFCPSLAHFITDMEKVTIRTGSLICDGDRQVTYRSIVAHIQIKAVCSTRHRTDTTHRFHRRCCNFDIAFGMVSSKFYSIIWIVNTAHNIGSMDIVHFGSRCRNHIWILFRIHRFDSRIANGKSAISGVDRGIAHNSTHGKCRVRRTDIHRDIIFIYSEIRNSVVSTTQSRIDTNHTAKTRTYRALRLCILDGGLNLVFQKLYTTISPGQSSDKSTQVTILVCSAVVSRLESHICIRHFKNGLLGNAIR